MFILMTDQSQKAFQVSIIGQINSVSYNKQEIDNIVRLTCKRFWKYIDNIICEILSMSYLVAMLCRLFEIFVEYNISIKQTKFLLNYPNMRFLGQHVSFLRLTIAKDELQALQLLSYFNTLRVLKYYLGLTCYGQFYIHFCCNLGQLPQF